MKNRKENIINLINKVKLNNGKKFQSEFLYNKPYKYSNKEDLRWLFWLTELQEWLRLNTKMYVMVDAKNGKYYPKISFIDKQTKYYELYFYDYSLNDEYIDALEIGIEETLKSLK